MLRALEDLEKAVRRLLEEIRTGEEGVTAPPSVQAGQGSQGSGDEAAELIRRAIKRLRSL